MGWQLTQCLWHDKQQLNTLLADSWEPFAVSECDGPTVWLRRQASKALIAEVIEPPRRPRQEPEAAPR